MADQVVRTDKVAGYFMLDPIDATKRGYLFVEKRTDGEWYDAELDAKLEAFEIPPIEDIVEMLNLIGRPPVDAATKLEMLR